MALLDLQGLRPPVMAGNLANSSMSLLCHSATSITMCLADAADLAPMGGAPAGARS